MSGFSADWLALREPVDHRSRHAGVAAACAAHFSTRGALAVTDLGCGSGSNLRALAPLLPARQSWLLADHDPDLLAAARAALLAWAEQGEPAGPELRLQRGGKEIAVRFMAADLSQSAAALLAAADLVTATALFDLCSEPWLVRFAADLAARRLPLLATLTYDGAEAWRPPHAADGEIHAAFLRHQAGDKGFGPSAGPRAAAVLAAALAGRGYRVIQGDSPWRLGQGDAELIAALAEGAAAAARETALIAPALVDSWLEARRQAVGCDIGHVDFFAAPG